MEKDSISLKGRVEIFQTKGIPNVTKGEIDFSECELLDTIVDHNIIVGIGKDKVIQALTTGFINQIARMAIGDRGTIPSDPTQPKVASPDQTELFNEVFRSDNDTFVLDIGNTPGVHEVKFIKTFSAVTIPLASFSNQALPVVNEVGLIMVDLNEAPLPRADVAAPNPPLSDESLFSIRTFKSVPFEAANEISITIRYTIYIE